MAGDRDRMLQAGMDDYVSKPLRSDELFRALERFAPRAVDGGVLLQGVDGNRKLLRELIDVFTADLPKMVSRIKTAIAKQDAVRLRDAAHALKGAVGNFDQGASFEAVRRLEMLARENLLTNAEASFRNIRNQLAQLTRSLRHLKSQL